MPKSFTRLFQFGYQIHGIVMALFAHQNCLSSIAKSGSGVLLLWLCQGPRCCSKAACEAVSCKRSINAKPPKQIQRKKKTRQYGWFCVSDLQDVDKNRMPKIIQNHLEFVWTGFSLRIYLFWIRSCCVCSFAMDALRQRVPFSGFVKRYLSWLLDEQSQKSTPR